MRLAANLQEILSVSSFVPFKNECSIFVTILMIAIRQYTYFLSFILFAASTSFAQSPKDPTLKPDRSRELFHDYVDTEQKKALQSDKKDDK